MAMQPRFEILLGQKDDGRWYWRLRAANGRIIAIGGEAFMHRRGAERACTLVMKIVTDAWGVVPIIKVEE